MRPTWIATAVLAGLIALLALWLRAGVVGGQQWSIDWLDVEGDLSRTSSDQVRAAVIGEAGKGFFAADLQQVRAAVEALPWVAQAEVSRQWPDALSIRVVEHRPLARWNDSGLFSDRGEVFRVDGSDGMQGLARLHGPENRRREVLDTWLEMRRALADIGQDIERLAVDERGAWQAELGNGVTLVLGRESMHERLERYIGVHPALSGRERRARVVDLRYTNGLAVRWAGESTGEQADHG
ncbi:cell division protein FtsQ/DivIB [Wenzhouxiangella sp. AB-CW3]|uniref:cell division protein FtsQ/DivIB n=1 Tax=Wenzhouxiangella sp. AB-CW3 TaxID=2771012 RepID=UPI00168BA63F|nr:cell division protein FtsQ/DivIB [Wenzhouxiangella sp. AB-CW3]QOC23200.1 cell division protein FtsQ/DivIB [Wenzhouxiangella sp. AB-CW3]